MVKKIFGDPRNFGGSDPTNELVIAIFKQYFNWKFPATVSCIRDHPYITSAKGLGGWVQKMAIFADVQYCIYADTEVGGLEKVQTYADVIYGWSLSEQQL